MASSAPRGSERMVHQDYIARIRYSNTLPPPPNPPKLLEIPNTGLASGQYTTPGFASRLARDQPLNIEADAELGMPLDLVGMPGIFDGDESSIQAPLNPPPTHPHDRALLKPLSTLGKPKFSDTGVSFLRRTEYISSFSSKSRFDANARSQAGKPMNRVRRPEPNVDRESPAYIKSQVEKSFEIAATNLENSSLTRHPTNRNLKVVSAHSLIPDLDAFPDAGGYITLKFLTNPVPPSKTYDTRLETGLLRPIAPTAEEAAAKDAAREAHERDPTRFPAPDEGIDYEYFLAESAQDAENFKRKFNVSDPDRDDDELYARKNGSGVGCFRFKRLRAYESASQAGSVYDKYDEEVMIAVHDGSDGLHENAAYYYPLVQRTAIRPQRNKNIQKQKLGFAGAETEETSITDYMDMAIEDPSEDMVALRDAFRDHPLGREGLAELAEQNGEAGEEDGDAKAGSKSPEPKDDDDEKSDS